VPAQLNAALRPPFGIFNRGNLRIIFNLWMEFADNFELDFFIYGFINLRNLRNLRIILNLWFKICGNLCNLRIEPIYSSAP